MAEKYFDNPEDERTTKYYHRKQTFQCCGPDKRTSDHIQFDWAWWRNVFLIIIMLVSIAILVISAATSWGLAKSGPMMVETSKATVDMHYQTTKMRKDVIAWGSQLFSDYPAQQDKIWLARADKITKNVEDLTRKFNLAVLADDLKLENMIPIAIHAFSVEMIEPETKSLLNKKVREALTYMRPHEIANAFKNFNGLGSFVLEMQQKGLIDRMLDIVEDGDTVFKGIIAYLNQPRKKKKRIIVEKKKENL